MDSFSDLDYTRKCQAKPCMADSGSRLLSYRYFHARLSCCNRPRIDGRFLTVYAFTWTAVNNVRCGYSLVMANLKVGSNALDQRRIAKRIWLLCFGINIVWHADTNTRGHSKDLVLAVWVKGSVLQPASKDSMSTSNKSYTDVLVLPTRDKQREWHCNEIVCYGVFLPINQTVRQRQVRRNLLGSRSL